MAANYWDSTQRKFWTFTKAELAATRKKLEDAPDNRLILSQYSLPDRRLLSIYFYQRMFENFLLHIVLHSP
jgi:cyclin-C